MARGRKPVAGQLGVVTRNVVSLRAKPDADSEQVSQALIGQPVVAEGGQKNWLFVQTWDTYRGWIESEAVNAVRDRGAPYASTGPVAIVRELIVDIHESPNERSRIVTKATVAAELEVARTTDDWVELALPDGRHGFLRRQDARLVDKDVAGTIPLPDPRRIVETALRFVGVPYLWGGTTPFGLDCSGFTQLVYRIHNVTLLRDSTLQFSDPRGHSVEKNDLHAGDLLFFGRDKITHVGLALGGGEFVHSRSQYGVIVSSIDEPHYASIYQGARRMRVATLDPGGGAPED